MDIECCVGLLESISAHNSFGLVITACDKLTINEVTLTHEQLCESHHGFLRGREQASQHTCVRGT